MVEVFQSFAFRMLVLPARIVLNSNFVKGESYFRVYILFYCVTVFFSKAHRGGDISSYLISYWVVSSVKVHRILRIIMCHNFPLKCGGIKICK